MQRPPLTAGECAWLGRQLAAAVGGMHQGGLVHGDVAPGNILIRADAIVLLDCLAVVREDERGTPGFRAPERMAGDLCEASDVYSIGAVLRWAARDADVEAVRKVTRLMVDPDPERRPAAAEIPEHLGQLGASTAIAPLGDANVATALRSTARLRTERTTAGRWWRARAWAIRGGSVTAAIAAVAAVAVWWGADTSQSASAREPVAAPRVLAGKPAWSDTSAGAATARQAATVLTQTRFQALDAGDGPLLRTTVSGDDETAVAVRELADRLDAGEVTFSGLQGQVLNATVIESAPQAATVAVSYETTAHSVTVGELAQHVAATAETVVLDLELSSRGWTVVRVLPRP